MASYTQTDIEASSKFAEANNYIRIVQKLYERAPHIASWLEISIRDATNDDYYIPATLKDSAKVVSVKIPEKLCTLLSCTPMKERDTCKPNEAASYYYVGTEQYDVQCQPSCYHLAAKISYDDSGARAVDIPQLNWNKMQQECRLVNSAMVSWLEKTFYRSDTKYELRVNDMPTGFSRIESDNPYGCGWTYKTNAAYCQYYDRTLQSDGSCDMTLLEKIVDAVIGQTLINYVKSSIRMLTNNGVPFALPSNLPTLPSELKPEHTLEGWRNNINADFVVPELIDTKPKLESAYSESMSRGRRKKRNVDTAETIHDFRRRAELESVDDMSNFMRSHVGMALDPEKVVIIGRKTAQQRKQQQQQKAQPEVKRRTKRSARFNIRAGTTTQPPQGTTKLTDDDGNEIPTNESDDSTSKKWHEYVKDVFILILKMFSDPNTYLNLGIDFAMDAALKKIKSLALKVVEKMSTYLAKGMLDVTGSIGTKVLVTGIRGLSVKLVTNMAIRIGAKIAIMLAKILAAAASVIGWLLVGTMLLDMLFSFWDPFGYNNMFPPELPNDMMESGELAFRQSLESATATFKFDNLAAIILSEDELLEIQLSSLIDRMIYLDALVVNSEGSRINKGPEINLQDGTKYDMELAQNAGMAERVKFDPKTFEEYNDKFMVRVNLNKYLNYIAGSSVIIAGVFMVTRLPILCMVAIIVAVVALALSRLELQDDILVDFLSKYRNKVPFYDNSDYGFSYD
ncbi:p74 protein [Oryctes rhinoceros nudivirus]|uniref:p74 protein n=1 Tax=Oryctes rhinoceros nudivirus TaxID=92521 RepID=B7SVE7_9VIRU|nr:p74 protein [Oryctes rhinoceros nudivirus]ACH96256.1 p74 protein [Oryctes rhinoceros nudivirus]QHG11358.1 p74 protein [Oryctes rhinoceros nudivirus]WAQ80124.1 p74 protein [Oryctes rhinoceros nudivirus]